MESTMIMDLDMDELRKVCGGEDAEMTYDEAFEMVKRLVRVAMDWNRSYEEALRLMIFAYGDVLPEADIEAYVRWAYGL